MPTLFHRTSEKDVFAKEMGAEEMLRVLYRALHDTATNAPELALANPNPKMYDDVHVMPRDMFLDNSAYLNAPELTFVNNLLVDLKKKKFSAAEVIFSIDEADEQRILLVAALSHDTGKLDTLIMATYGSLTQEKAEKVLAKYFDA